MDSASRGYDLSVVDANEADAQRACMKLGVPISTRIFNEHVPNDALGNGDPNLLNGYKEHRGSPIPNYFVNALTYRGRCMRCPCSNIVMLPGYSHPKHYNVVGTTRPRGVVM
jgi:hypothetical protein